MEIQKIIKEILISDWPEKKALLPQKTEDLYDLDIKVTEQELQPYQQTLSTYTCGTCAVSVCPCRITQATGSDCNC